MSDLESRLALMPPDRRLYTLCSLPAHLAQASQTGRLRHLLTNFSFMLAKAVTTGPQALIEDYNLAISHGYRLLDHEDDAGERSFRLIQEALRLSADVIARDPSQLPGQLLGRLLSFADVEIEAMLAQAREWKGSPWLRPLTPSLNGPDGPLIRTLRGDTYGVLDLALTPDGRHAIAASQDESFTVWDIQTGTKLRTLSGHSEVVPKIWTTG